jgi:hypothetical protein
MLGSIKWIALLTPPILPGVNGAMSAKAGGYLDILEWMASLESPILLH